ncbi:hypothetical protein AVEN_230747-1 [Araneus ventricosus]|uniref:Uncharacterized protein n=1 Tax=Araneus ventricosus TaxID=182803 RepID=A0A4Y2A1S0_ARAVE|nr:hypothetical protein AVEN_230747-1 [Araneus ventricosus]
MLLDLFSVLWLSICSYKVVLTMTIVGVFEPDYPVAKEVVNKMFDSFIKQEIPDADFKYVGVDIEDGLSESVGAHPNSAKKFVNMVAVNETFSSTTLGKIDDIVAFPQQLPSKHS